MATKHLAEFYSFKEIPLAVLTTAEPPEPPDPARDALEAQIRTHIAAGHRAFFKGKYAAALQAYLAAWVLLPQAVYPDFPMYADEALALDLLTVDLTVPLLEASIEVLRRRHAVGPRVPIVPSVEPPAALFDLADRVGGPVGPARRRYGLGLAATRMGDPDLAERWLREALELGAGDPAVQADGTAALAALELMRGNHEGAVAALGSAGEAYRAAGRRDGAAAMEHNLGVVRTLAGDAEAAGRHFAAASVAAPDGLGWQVTHALNPGIASVARPMGGAGLPLLLAEGSAWVAAAADSAPLRTTGHLVVGGAALELDLAGGGAQALQQAVLEPRVGAETLVALATSFVDASGRYVDAQFVSHLAHVRGFVLPVALADTYRALGDFQRAETYYLAARDYAYLNLAIERPVVWRKLAETYLEWGNRLFRRQDTAGAVAQYERVVRTADGGFELSGPLYDGTFAALAPETLAFLQAPEGAAATALDYGRRLVLLEALANLNRIANGINALGFPDDIIPIHPWRYLQNVARYFAGQAIQAERSYITFKSTAEEAAFTRLTLEQAVDAQEAALAVERERYDLAGRQRDVAFRTAELAALRQTNAIEQRADQQATAERLAAFDEMTAYASAADQKVHVDPDWAGALGIQVRMVKEETWNIFTGSQTYEYVEAFQGRDLMRLLTRNRGKITRDYELRAMDRKLAEIEQEVEVAQAEVAVAEQVVEVAWAERNLARVRRDQAQDQLAFYNAQEFTPEQWDNLAQAQRGLSRRYLDWAIGAAFLMERAYNVEEDAEARRIRFDYERSELRGLLAADFLLADIDQFSYDRLLATEKRIPVKVSIALADRYPFQFRRFQETGRIDFDTALEDFDRWHPGTYVRKLRRVEVVIEGLVGPQGIHGTLTHAGISVDRDRAGRVRRLVRKPETMVLSRFDLRGDGFAFVMGEEGQLAVFENSGPAGGWILDFPPESNDVDYRMVANVHLVLYYDARYREDVRDTVRAELAAVAVHEHAFGLGVAFQYPDEFFAFQDTGVVTFEIGAGSVPHDHTEPTLRDVYLLVETDEGTPAAGLAVGVALAGGAVAVTQATDANGMLATDAAGAAMNALRGRLLVDRWTVTIERDANAAAFATGFSWEKVRNLVLFAEYDYTPRGRPTVEDEFTDDPLPAFEVVDDPRATGGAPSAWAHDPAAGRVTQTAAIAGPPGAAGADPDKPGGYLVARTPGDWPVLRDAVVRCRLSAAAPGGIGLVFRYQDADNFGFFLMDAGLGYRRLGVKEAGVFRELETPAVDETVGFEVGREYELAVGAVGDAVVACLDGEPVLRGRDRALRRPGRVGLYTWGDAAARFERLSVRPV